MKYRLEIHSDSLTILKELQFLAVPIGDTYTKIIKNEPGEEI